MKFVYFGYDFMLPSVQRLIADGHQLVGIFSFEVDNIFNFNTGIQSLAQKYGVPFILSKPEDHHLKEFISQGCEVFFSAGYPYKIPPVDESAALAVNIHPTYLPHARGLMPIPRIILQNATNAAGFTAHKMTQKFDGGDILLQKKFPLLPQETVETYTAKIAMRAPDMVSELFAEIKTLWRNARAQNEKAASHYKPPTDQDRLLDWDKKAEELDRIARAFGRFGSIAQTEHGTFVAYDITCWKEPHAYKTGAIVATSSRDITLACRDGFVCLKEFYPVQ
jgi:methionyl-tRNA formyltransferase